MSIKELRKSDEDGLRKKLIDLRKEQFNLRFQASNGSLENTSRVGFVRRDIARIKTLLTEKKLLQKGK